MDTGVELLNRALGGGFPTGRSMLVTGGPGTGKSTLAMQFLQAGIERGERCLYVSTEQTPDELRDAFEPFAFDLDHEDLVVTSVHATHGTTFESGDESTLTLETLDEEEVLGGEFGAPFEARYIQQYLERFGPCDRVVFDSISGLAPMARDEDAFRRAVLDLVQLFTDDFGATTVFTAEGDGSESTDGGGVDDLQYSTHGVIRLWRERVEGDVHRYLRVLKLRGVDHDTRRYEVEIGPRGVHLAPRHRTRSQSFLQHEFETTNVPGLDELTGGGFVRGSTALVEHDGRAEVNTIILSLIEAAYQNDQAIVFFPSANMEPDRFDRMLPEGMPTVEELLAEDRLFVLDFVGTWSHLEKNVYSFGQANGLFEQMVQEIRTVQFVKIKRAVERVNRARGERSVFTLLYTESLLQRLRPEEVRQMYYWAKGNLLRPDDRVLFVQNPGVMDDSLAEFYAYDSEQVLRTWLEDDGLQYIKLEKSPSGDLGRTGLVHHVDEPPYVRVQRHDSRESVSESDKTLNSEGSPTRASEYVDRGEDD
ncbi:ATPase domain-containing protein [Halospeciosus flavus]|uniref:ATPase domain-containing protein n=1 Tax=Halospeciosus flavus TaxID=3032283 RepID=UPI002442D007|nr:ATPase domain-containing protein [Halospeciosus flavus]